MNTVDVAVWGSSGYAGQELVGILEEHPNVNSVLSVGRETPNDIDDVEVAFLALPHGESARVAQQLRRAGSTVIDLSGDFRLQTPEEYETWYSQAHAAPELLPAPYALPELRHEGIRGSKLIAIPGCYPTAVLLGIMPLVKAGYLESDAHITVDAISGVSGMGKGKKEHADQILASGDIYTYSVGRVHRHVGEMEQFLYGKEVFFSPSVGSYFRGIVAKTTAQLN